MYGFEGQQSHSNPVQGDWVFQTIFFSHFQGQNIFSNLLWARIFFSGHSGPEYCFLAHYKFGSQLYSYESVTRLLYWGCLSVCLSVCHVCLSVCPSMCVACPSAITLKWHANFKYIAIQLDMSELGQTMTIHAYDFIWARWIILSNVRTDYDLT